LITPDVAAAGTATTIDVADELVGLAAATPLKVTAFRLLVVLKPEPVIVTEAPATAPTGANEVTATAAWDADATPREAIATRIETRRRALLPWFDKAVPFGGRFDSRRRVHGSSITIA
jgi:hypothetical protein